MVSRTTRMLLEKRMRDIRKFQQKTPSDSQINKKFKTVQQALGDLSSSLMSSFPDVASQVDDLGGVVRRLAKEAGVS